MITFELVSKIRHALGNCQAMAVKLHGWESDKNKEIVELCVQLDEEINNINLQRSEQC